MKPSYTFNTDLALVLLFCLAVNIPYFNPTFLVAHDTRNIYALFHYFYNHFVWHGEIPRWLPYGEYGYGTLWYQISNFSPATYLLGLAGWLAGIRDTLLLFKLSVLAEQLIFVLGLHLLSGRLYQCRFTRLAVCVAGAGSVIWHWQLYWDLRLYYLIPLALYFYHRFLTERLPWAFWAALLTMLMSLVGGLAYWAPVYLLLFMVLNAILLPAYWRSLSCLIRPGWKACFLMILFALCVVSFSHIYATCLDGLHNYSPGRSVEGMHALLQSFLTYSPPIWGLLHAFLDGTVPGTDLSRLLPDDMTLYVGLFALAGIAVAIVSVRSRWFLAMLGVLVTVILISGSGFFSWIAYHGFPEMDRFRHLSLLLEIGKLFLLLSSGFGMEIIFRKIAHPDWLTRHFRLSHLFMLLSLLGFIFDMVVSVEFHRESSWTSQDSLKELFPDAGIWIFIRLCGWSILLGIVYLVSISAGIPAATKGARYLPMLLVLVCSLDLWSFQMYHWDNRNDGTFEKQLENGPIAFQHSRRISVSRDSLDRISRLWDQTPGSIFLAYYSNIFNHDPCIPMGRVDLFPRNVHELLLTRGANPGLEKLKLKFSMQDSSLNTVLGCETGKIRIVRQAQLTESDGEAMQFVQSIPRLDSTAVLRGAHPPGMPFQYGTGQYVPEYAVKDFNANRLDLEINVPPGGSGWLVYADSWNENWKAFVNGKEAPLYEAYLAFKSVFVGEGMNRVVFEYRNIRQRYAIHCLMISGTLFALSCLIWLLRRILTKT